MGRKKKSREETMTIDDYNTTICSTMIPPSPLAPDDSNCWQWWDAFDNGNLIENPPPVQKGCDYEPCHYAVCACDSYCCDVAWDISCRGYELEPGDSGTNYFAEGCSARSLCCEQETAFPKPPMLSSSNPTSANIPSSSPNADNQPFFASVPIAIPTIPVPPNIIIQTPQPTIMVDTCATMIPPSKVAPNDSDCWQWYDPNNNSKPGTPGCDYKPCQDAVCACDSYCCDIAWDLSCRGYNDGSDNYYVVGCSASLLCCEQDDAYPKPPVYVAYSSIRRFNYNN